MHHFHSIRSLHCLALLAAFTTAGITTALSEPTQPPKEATIVGQHTVTWHSHYDHAQKISAQSGHLMLLDFTGSDWCIWCKRLHKEILAQPFFEHYAKSNLVLVVVDFPQAIVLPDDIKAQNARLAKQYGVTSYPTVILTDSKGKELGRVGYMEGGPKTFVRAIKRFVARNAKSGDAPRRSSRASRPRV